jgi:hypothetical protein
MRELISQEIQHVCGGSFLGDLQSMGQNGMTHPEKTLGVLALATGLSVGSFLPKLLGPLCGVGLIIGWVIYDLQTQVDSTPAPATT